MTEDGGAPGRGSSAPAEARARATHASLASELRASVRQTIDEWLSERSNTVGLAVAQLVEDTLARVQSAHASRLADVERGADARVAALEAEHAEALRSARRRRRARVRETERELREKIERLERHLTAASLETVEKLRDVERREHERRLEVERSWQQRLREKEDEILRLRSGGAGAGASDHLFDSLHDQLRRRDPSRS